MYRRSVAPPQTRRAHQSCHALAADADPVVIRKLRMNGRRAIHLLRASVDRLDLRRQRKIRPISLAHRSLQPRIEPASRNLQQSAHDPDRVGGLVHLHEPEATCSIVPIPAENTSATCSRFFLTILRARSGPFFPYALYFGSWIKPQCLCSPCTRWTTATRVHTLRRHASRGPPGRAYNVPSLLPRGRR
jgi:hypothetical protein